MKKDTFFNISTKGNETQNQSTSKSKRKIFKAFGFGSLAVMMAVAGTFAFAPLGAAAPLAIAESGKTTYTTEQGLITPKADDPVIYTTKSGLDIKFGLSAPNISHSGTNVTGNMSGYPYFQTSKSGITYTWVVIGRATDVQIFSGGRYTKAFSSWKSISYPTTAYRSGAEPFAKSFFDNTYENSTPAGHAIDVDLSSKGELLDSNPNNIPKTNSEIPSGSVLCLSNNIISTICFASGNETISKYLSHEHNNIRTTAVSDFNDDTYGFGNIKSNLKEITLTQRNCGDTSWNATGTWATTSVALHFFPLANYSATYENFMWQSYLTAAQVKSTANFWGRSCYSATQVYITNTSGTATYAAGRYSHEKAGYRPACVISIL